MSGIRVQNHNQVGAKEKTVMLFVSGILKLVNGDSYSGMNFK